MALWGKNSGHENASLVELFPNGQPVDGSLNYLLKTQKFFVKNDKHSVQLRGYGNEKFRAECWHEAMEMYNQSLRFANEGSENISLAYANRSACFLHMKKYDGCSTDIELARKANYPQRLMPKLDQRQAECLKLMNETPELESKMKLELSFDPDEKFPCMANVLEIRTNDEFGKHIAAKQKLEVGQIVLIDEVFVFDDMNCDRTKCENCLQFVKNFIPCPNCTDVMFCGTKCMESNDIHRLSCGTSFHGTRGYKDLVQTISTAVSAFSDVDELIKFVGKSLETHDFCSLEGISGAQLRYGQFLKLAALQKKINREKVASTYQLLFRIPKIQQLFDSTQKQRFLMHLLWQHILIIETNGINFGADEGAPIGVVGNFMSLFNHACYHNTALRLCGNQIIGYVVRPIGRGEQLFIRYSASISQSSTGKRKSYLRKNFQFECKCSKCVPCFEKSDCIRMQSDPIYELIVHPQVDNCFLDQKKRSFYKQKFRQFLNKYGRLPWSLEIEMAVLGFMGCMNEDFKLI